MRTISMIASIAALSVGGIAVNACGKKDAPPAPAAVEGAEHTHPPGTPAHDDGAMMGGHGHEGGAMMGGHGHEEGAMMGEHTHDGDKAHEDGDDHAHTAGAHGGAVKSAGDYHLEGVASALGFLVFPLDAKGAPVAVEGFTGDLLFAKKDGTPPVEAAFAAMGDHLHAKVEIGKGPWTAVVTLKVGGGTVSARFEGSGLTAPAGDDGHGHEHGDGDQDHPHDH